MIVLFSAAFVVLDWKREIMFFAVPFFHTKGSAVEVNSVIMDTCFESTIATFSGNDGRKGS